MRPAGLAVLESRLLASAVERALADPAVQVVLASNEISPAALTQQLRRDPTLLDAAGRHAVGLHALAERRESLAEAIRVVHDPDRAYYLRGARRPEPPDLIRDRLNPAGRALYQSVRTWLVAPAVVALLVVAAIASPPAFLAVAAVTTGAVILAYAVGLVNRMRRRAEATSLLSFTEWLARRTAGGFEAGLDRLVEHDGAFRAARRQELDAWNAAESDLVQRHVLPRVRHELTG
ncbi:MAG: hypothetical protein ACRD1K_00525 [Acidimicrobiales bacterium]